MGPLSFLRRAPIGLGRALLALGVLPATARANELPASAVSSGFVIHDAAETLRDFCFVDGDGVTWFQIPGGMRWELVTSPADPAIANPGDGAFHPFDGSEVRAALAEVNYPLARVGAEIFLLPYPRRAGLESAAGAGIILLSPGMVPLSGEHQHAEFIHELGHVVQYALMPDSDESAWRSYRGLRGIADETVYFSSAPHADRPHEIFAEDFRATFGDPLANYSGSIENSALAPPAEVSGLADFMRGLAGSAITLAAAPNPTRGATQFSRTGATREPLELFDLSGRRVAVVAPTSFAAGTAWHWNGRDAAGRRVGPGVLFARVHGERTATRFVIAP
ncbi:MAG: hypothetical protein HYR73_01655 [Candidatus Eisenbacteria bacterium]|nr:hypothetical protein [Candidatus Eisenbacteria bacterium]